MLLEPIYFYQSTFLSKERNFEAQKAPEVTLDPKKRKRI